MVDSAMAPFVPKIFRDKLAVAEMWLILAAQQAASSNDRRKRGPKRRS
jgi:hypothetical protein